MDVVEIDLKNETHKSAIIDLMQHYMLDPMGGGKAMPEDLPVKMLNGLIQQSNYVGFLLRKDSAYVALANCFVGFSTFKAKQLINVHDFVVKSKFRGQGVGKYLLQRVESYAKQNSMCRVTLEVREDNNNAMALYKKLGFKPCAPNMYFWELNV